MRLGLLLSLWAAAVPAQTTALGLEYAQVDGFSLRLDLFRPAETPAAGSPVVLWVHGGGWCSGARAPLPDYAGALVAQGFAVAAASYRLISTTPNCANAAGVDWPLPLHDLKAAVRWLRANSAALALDPARIGIWGQSAGGHLALALAYTAGQSAYEGTVGSHLGVSSEVQAVLAYFPPSELIELGPDFARTPPGRPDLVATVEGPGQPHAHLIGFGAAGEGIGLIRQNLANPLAPWPARVSAARSASPLYALDPAAPPTYLLHGAADLVVPVQQSRRLASALAASGVPHQYVEVAGLGHVPPPAVESAAARLWIAGVLRSAVFADGFEASAPASLPR
jgi:acetyl esterase/lipase